MKSTQAIHTFNLKSNAKQIEVITDEIQLTKLVKASVPYVILGEGSNSIFLEDFQGLVLINELKGVTVKELSTCFELSVRSGENWHELVQFCLNNGMHGFENLALIPGTVGAAPIQNIGAYGVEIERFITQVHYNSLIDGEIHVINNEDCQFGYRDSIFKHELKNKAFITQVDFNLPKAWKPVCSYSPIDKLSSPKAKDIFDVVCETRKQKLPDPQILGNSGSFFKNPIVNSNVVETIECKYKSVPSYPVDEDHKKLAAGWLIDQAGLKGFEHKNVAVHDAQALVLVNKTGKATGSELVELINIVREAVHEKFAVKLELEVRLIGASGEIYL